MNEGLKISAYVGIPAFLGALIGFGTDENLGLMLTCGVTGAAFGFAGYGIVGLSSNVLSNLQK